jgi:hypothetical protein
VTSTSPTIPRDTPRNRCGPHRLPQRLLPGPSLPRPRPPTRSRPSFPTPLGGRRALQDTMLQELGTQVDSSAGPSRSIRGVTTRRQARAQAAQQQPRSVSAPQPSVQQVLAADVGRAFSTDSMAANRPTGGDLLSGWLHVPSCYVAPTNTQWLRGPRQSLSPSVPAAVRGPCQPERRSHASRTLPGLPVHATLVFDDILSVQLLPQPLSLCVWRDVGPALCVACVQHPLRHHFTIVCVRATVRRPDVARTPTLW